MIWPVSSVIRCTPSSYNVCLPLWLLFFDQMSKWFEAVLRSVKPWLANAQDSSVMINLIWCLSFSPRLHFFFPPQSVKSEEEIKACWAQVKSDIKVSKITDKTDYVYWILTFKKSEISTKAEFVDGLSVKWIKLADSVWDCVRLIVWKCRLIQWLLCASRFWHHRLILALLPFASHTNPPSYVPLEFIHIYNNV